MENVKLCEELEVQKVNLRDINEFLTNELKARSLAGAALEQRIEDLEVELEGLRESTAVSRECCVMRTQDVARAANMPILGFVAWCLQIGSLFPCKETCRQGWGPGGGLEGQ